MRALALLLGLLLGAPAWAETPLPPTIELPAQGQPAEVLAIFYSGDGGWADIDRTIGNLMVRDRVSVVGVNVLKEFWSVQTPEQAAAGLEALIRHYTQAWKLDRVALVGFSFGADLLPHLYPRLSKEAKAHIVSINLLAPERFAEFEIQVSGWVGGGPSKNAKPTEPEMAKIDPALVQCLYGEKDTERTLCVTPALAKAEIVHTPGAHHFDENYPLVEARIVNAIRLRLAAASQAAAPPGAPSAAPP